MASVSTLSTYSGINLVVVPFRTDARNLLNRAVRVSHIFIRIAVETAIYVLATFSVIVSGWRDLRSVCGIKV